LNHLGAEVVKPTSGYYSGNSVQIKEPRRNARQGYA